MLRIGEFSVLSQISIHMLRHYNEIGLLIPEYIDDFTGYRYYSEKQLPIANKIKALKSMGLSLSLIKEILTKYTDNNDLKKYLELHAVEQREKIENMQQQLNLIETTIENLGHSASVPLYSVVLKKYKKGENLKKKHGKLGESGKNVFDFIEISIYNGRQKQKKATF